jgi:probable rRNA maturation factor
MTSVRKDQTIAIRIAEDFGNIKISAPKLKKLIKAVRNQFGGSETPDARFQISLAIVDDAHIRKLNSRFLGHNVTTDCLSFDLSDRNAAETGASASRVLEIVVNGQMAARQAERRGHSTEAELALYVTHGLLHQLGFDDATKKTARKMHQTEDDILQQLGYGPVYNKNS